MGKRGGEREKDGKRTLERHLMEKRKYLRKRLIEGEGGYALRERNSIEGRRLEKG
jgi:hypothetical protein